MAKGRSPCCDKSMVKRGPWSPAEDMRLISFIHRHGHANWRALPRLAGLLRCGKSCRLRWINYLRPDVKRGNFSAEEEATIINLQRTFGNKWSKIAGHLPGRTDNEIKNVWNTYLKKRVIHGSDAGRGRQIEMISSDSFPSYYVSPNSPSPSSCISYGDLVLDLGDGEDQDQEDQESNTTFDPSPTIVSSVGVGQQESNSDGAQQPSLNTSANARDDSQIQTSVTKEATKESVGDGIIEIPWPVEYSDDDMGIWSNLLGGCFDPKGESNIVAQAQDQCYDEVYPMSSLGETHAHDQVSGEPVSQQKWFKFFENQLGLSEGTESDPALNGEDPQQQEELVTRGTDEEMIIIPRLETDDDMAYFEMWSLLT